MHVGVVPDAALPMEQLSHLLVQLQYAAQALKPHVPCSCTTSRASPLPCSRRLSPSRAPAPPTPPPMPCAFPLQRSPSPSSDSDGEVPRHPLQHPAYHLPQHPSLYPSGCPCEPQHPSKHPLLSPGSGSVSPAPVCKEEPVFSHVEAPDSSQGDSDCDSKPCVSGDKGTIRCLLPKTSAKKPRPGSFAAPPRNGRKFKGVRRRKWGKAVCEIRGAEGKRIWLGSHESEDAAARVYDEAARILQGPSAWLNFPGEPAGTVLLPRGTIEELKKHRELLKIERELANAPQAIGPLSPTMQTTAGQLKPPLASQNNQLLALHTGFQAGVKPEQEVTVSPAAAPMAAEAQAGKLEWDLVMNYLDEKDESSATFWEKMGINDLDSCSEDPSLSSLAAAVEMEDDAFGLPGYGAVDEWVKMLSEDMAVPEALVI